MYFRTGVIVTFFLLTGCAGGPPKPGPARLDFNRGIDTRQTAAIAADPRDPFEGANRAMWVINYDLLEPHVARPIVHSYARYVPKAVQEGIRNFVDNFDEPSSMVNHAISGDIKGAGNNLGRFAMNTTVGLLGIFDVAQYVGLKPNKLAMNTVLGNAEIGDGAYVMAPVYGPTTTRKLVGDTIDTLYFPYALLTLPLKIVYWGLDGLGSRAKLIEQERIIDNAMDPYGLTKDIFLQHNQGKVDARRGGRAVDESSVDHGLDDYLDEIDP